MFAYYVDLAWRSLKRNKVLTSLMVLAIGLGIGASMTMLTVLHVMTANPIPGKSAKLFYPQVDPQPVKDYAKDRDPPDQWTWPDAMNLLRAGKGVHQAAMSGGWLTVIPSSNPAHAFHTHGRYTTPDFFAMFDVPFIAGTGWTKADGNKRARDAVISRHLADKLYGTPHALGKTLRLGKYDFRVVGVIDDWNPVPHFYDLSLGNYVHSEQVFLPLHTAMDLKMATLGNFSCWTGFPSGVEGLMHSDGCAWMQYWVELDTPEQVAAYRQYLVHYSRQQKQLGRFERSPNIRLRNVMQWLSYNKVVPGSVQLQSLLALGFLLVCLVNTVAMLLVKFLRRGGELSVRRAMGAGKRSVFAQMLVEAGLIGLASGVVGLGLAAFGLWVVRQQPVPYADSAHLDPLMLAGTFVLALVATLFAALFPAWRACRLAPARLLKTQ
jgi:putative ABC transport system permease protein